LGRAFLLSSAAPAPTLQARRLCRRAVRAPAHVRRCAHLGRAFLLASAEPPLCGGVVGVLRRLVPVWSLGGRHTASDARTAGVGTRWQFWSAQRRLSGAGVISVTSVVRLQIEPIPHLCAAYIVVAFSLLVARAGCLHRTRGTRCTLSLPCGRPQVGEGKCSRRARVCGVSLLHSFGDELWLRSRAEQRAALFAAVGVLCGCVVILPKRVSSTLSCVFLCFCHPPSLSCGVAAGCSRGGRRRLCASALGGRARVVCGTCLRRGRGRGRPVGGLF
jgi:hypothetical protein